MSVNIRELIAEYAGGEVSVVGLLQDVQKREGYLSHEALEGVSAELGIPLARLYSLATFYRAFSLKPRGRHTVTCCLGTACHVRGAQRVVEAFERELGVEAGGTTEDMEFTLETVNCVAACAVAPVVLIDGDYHGHQNSAGASRLLRRYKERWAANDPEEP
jgi:NADH-quinone oxidoreductase subunit E